jgi:serine/threonine protein kinase
VVIKNLGKGGFGEVFLVLSEKLDRQYAIKRMKRKDIKSAKREVQFGYISHLSWELFVKYYEKIEDGDYIYTVMDYFSNGSLYDIIKKCQSEKRKLSFTVNILLYCYYFFFFEEYLLYFWTFSNGDLSSSQKWYYPSRY